MEIVSGVIYVIMAVKKVTLKMRRICFYFTLKCLMWDNLSSYQIRGRPISTQIKNIFILQKSALRSTVYF